MSAEQKRRVYIPSATMERFHNSTARVRGVLGPIGSGKSVGCVMELARRGMTQEPDSDGIRVTRFLAVRNSYPQLASTTIKTWEAWMPQAKVMKTSPITWRWQARDIGDGTGIDMEVVFMALDSPDDVGRVKSLDVTGIWVNEAGEIQSFQLITDILGRSGRFPEKARVGLTWEGMVMDTNALDDRHWWYEKAEKEKPKGWEFFRQPAAVVKGLGGEWVINPECENVEHQQKGAAYWLDMTNGAAANWIKLYLEAEYGTIIDGRPVYPEYQDSRHCAAKDLEPYRGLPLMLGWDCSGLNPAVVVCQLSPKGQLRVYDELFAPGGIRQFCQNHVRPFLAAKYAGMEVMSVGDPAGSARASTDERSIFDEAASQGFPIRPARTNSFVARREAVAGYLTRNIEGGEPAFTMSPACVMLRKGFIGRYYLKRISTSMTQFKDEPEKNEFAHYQDALQYPCLDFEAPRVAIVGHSHARKIETVKYPY